jgi:hypothetical protein
MNINYIPSVVHGSSFLTSYAEVRHIKFVPHRYKITVEGMPSTHIGHSVRVSDVVDGAYGDEDYDVQEYKYTEIKWRKTI